MSYMIDLHNLSIGYKGRDLLKGADSHFKKGELTALIGRNGTGKSTLLRAIAGLNPNYTGEILVKGENLKGISNQKLAHLVSFVNTQRTRIPNMKCRDVVGMGRAPYTDWIGRLSRDDQEIVERSLELIGMTSFADRTLDTLSDGECQRIMIARCLAQSTPVILLDEPTSFLDLPTRYELVGLLHKLAAEEGKTILFSTHELEIALSKTDKIALLADQTLYNLSPEEMKSSGLIEAKFGDILR